MGCCRTRLLIIRGRRPLASARDAYIDRYYSLSEEAQLEQAREQGVYGRPLNEFELIDRHLKNSIGHHGGMTVAGESTKIMLTLRVLNEISCWYDVAENAETNLNKIDPRSDLKENDDRGGFFQTGRAVANAILAEFGNRGGLGTPLREQILESEAITRTMDWFTTTTKAWCSRGLILHRIQGLAEDWWQLVDD